ncbi:MAG: transcriptional regulator NrdR [Candidatus Doudnabacteria bacterium RIFCSPLOWO2_02_FULL_49_13]|uniref:Transcriptional repressor NrdR n=1 Tax=Candidatus Doudnabacteria bacterium RIFCSPHIGHO2_12_FULL_48_16 TaxID=1817838 RepID=A0A1F5PKJ9_9BACT|nr:MAG: transcriptional regulator NrdR [Candidatus Doudnabacteria bacterium RIFCSPHIGHO2_02_FULL_49_24]OGE89513.1 MAG: transcriptional regulator NrdR [Candidatus Doudnabacteria bacterium RIFCSPHIGHO2_01_FULL_50_67]OGE90192.1 MAG: transcriptional regulator NrdR [Candidatus Doudnabacteria bacterium RIFCSPHIGHO2_12_FULL_48_16]OGE97733.1 MAG: transcriptional regulator NrdR [Candidatus Doudnabacteria bacterium RIFCSPLOWO2_01_FULL_49_40]OGF02886.1 MAG: transcriptional regulator NrdR [Candidatus Doudn
MRCPNCQNDDTKVLDSRPISDGLAIRRRRECTKCGARFSTHEEMEILDLTVVKRDGRTEAYMREKIESGIRKAFEKRPLTRDDFHALVSGIEQDIQKSGKEQIPAKDIGNIVMRRIKGKDQVAYIRFASVYRQFADVEEFIKEAKKLE